MPKSYSRIEERNKKVWGSEIINALRRIENIDKFQIVQNKNGNIAISYTGNKISFKKIKEKITKLIGCNVEIKNVKNIKRYKSGKFPLVVGL